MAESGNIRCGLSHFRETYPFLINSASLSLVVITLSRSLFVDRLSSSLSSLPFRPLPLSRRYFRDDELQYAPIVAAGNQRAYPKSSMVSTHPTQPKPGLAQPGMSERTHIYRDTYTRTDVDTYNTQCTCGERTLPRGWARARIYPLL